MPLDKRPLVTRFDDLTQAHGIVRDRRSRIGDRNRELWGWCTKPLRWTSWAGSWMKWKSYSNDVSVRLENCKADLVRFHTLIDLLIDAFVCVMTVVTALVTQHLLNRTCLSRYSSWSLKYKQYIIRMNVIPR